MESLAGHRTPPRGYVPHSTYHVGLKMPRKHTRLTSLVLRFSLGRNNVSSTTITSRMGNDIGYSSANDSGTEDKAKSKQRKSSNKQSSLASLRASSLSISQTSFSTQRPISFFSFEKAPPLPPLPTLTSQLAVSAVPSEVSSLFPMAHSPFKKSWVNVTNTPFPPIHQSVSMTKTFQSASQFSISDYSTASASRLYVSLVCPTQPQTCPRLPLLLSLVNRYRYPSHPWRRGSTENGHRCRITYPTNALPTRHSELLRSVVVSPILATF